MQRHVFVIPGRAVNRGNSGCRAGQGSNAHQEPSLFANAMHAVTEETILNGWDMTRVCCGSCGMPHRVCRPHSAPCVEWMVPQ